MKISLTLWQRLNLEGIIRAKQSADNGEFLTLYETWKQIKVSDSTRKEYMANTCPTCGIGRQFDMERILAASELDVELEKAEARSVLALLADWKKFTVDDGEWMLSLKEKLKLASGDNPSATPKKEKASTAR